MEADDGTIALDQAILRAHDDLLGALELHPLGDDRFRARCALDRFGRVFGGQVLAQALLAAAATVDGQDANSLHAYFTGAGRPDHPLELIVDRVRDGRSLSVRRVQVTQSAQPLLVAMVSFHAENPAGPELGVPHPPAPRADELPLLQDWASDVPAELRGNAQHWIERPPPVELRIGEPPCFLGGRSATGPRSHWMRLPRDVGDHRALHAALMAYASDFFLLDMAFRAYPGPTSADQLVGVSLDHAIWIHRPVRFDRWHLHTQDMLALAGDRGLVRGSIHDAGGHLVASVAQEVLVRKHR